MYLLRVRDENIINNLNINTTNIHVVLTYKQRRTRNHVTGI